jgi:hypothetical protein
MKGLELLLLVVSFCITCSAYAAGRRPSKFRLSGPLTHPAIACTADELGRLRAAYRGRGPNREPVARRIRAADQALRGDLVFPPRGGQHNQWYQCDKCQIGLETVDASHHKCPKCGKVFSGAPYDDAYFNRVHRANLDRMLDAAWAWAVTDQKKYAAYARQVLVGYGERYRKYPWHNAHRTKPPAKYRKVGGRLFSQTLTEAFALAETIAPACDLLHGSGVLSEDDRATIRDGLIRPMLESIARNRRGGSNWQSWHNVALFAGGAMVGDADAAFRSIKDPSHGFLYQTRASITREGMWKESSWGYHFYALRALVLHAEYARRLGIDLWDRKPLRAMCLLPAQYVMPDGTFPRFGDSVTHKAAGFAGQIEPAYHALGDPTLLALLREKPTWESVLYGRPAAKTAAPVTLESRVFPDAGHAILRSGGEKKMAAVMTFGRSGGFHGHFDKLSFVFFGYGQELGVDPGRARSQAYRLPIHRHWYKATFGHNTVLVERSSQSAAGGALVAFRAGDSCSVAVAAAGPVYKGLVHRRLLCMTPAYLLVVDDVAPKASKKTPAPAERRFDWLYHNRGSAAVCRAAVAEAALDEEYEGRQYVKHVRGGRTDGTVRAVFRGPKVDTHLLAASAPGTGVRVGDGPGGSVTERIPMIVLSRRGRHGRFAVVLEPVRSGREPSVQDVVLEEHEQGCVVTVRTDRARARLTWDGRKTVELQREGKGVLVTP